MFFFAFQQEISYETNDSSAGDKFEDRRYPCGRVLVEKVWSKTHQGVTLPTVFFYSYPSVELNPSKSNINLHAFELWNPRMIILFYF